jgi:DNA uptake protein ComE-like DNA-binding protein
MNSGVVLSSFQEGRNPMRPVVVVLSTLAIGLATATLAQAPRQPKVSPPASKTEPWLQELPARRGLEPRPKSADRSVRTDINSASLKELLGLKNIGRTRADDIIKGRPYDDKDELVNRKILPHEVYDDIKDAVVAGHQSN